MDYTNPHLYAVSGATASVVVLVDRNEELLPAGGTIPVDLASSAEPNLALLDELLGATVVLDCSEGLPEQVVLDVLDEDVPPMFATSPWLDDHRVVVIRDGVGRVGGRDATYSPRAGLDISYDDSDY